MQSDKIIQYLNKSVEANVAETVLILLTIAFLIYVIKLAMEDDE